MNIRGIEITAVHPHEWIKNGDQIDIFAYDHGNHNGPRCSVCGLEFCHHCSPELYNSECSGKKRSKKK